MLFLGAALILSLFRCDAMYIQFETQRVPVDRILTNLQQRLARNSNDVQVLYYLARVHAMAYSTNLNFLNVRTNDNLPEFDYPGSDDGVPDGVFLRSDAAADQIARKHLTNAIWYYARAISSVFKGTNETAHRWLIVPIHLGYAWALDQAQRREEAVKAYRRALQLAWKREVDESFSLKEQVGWSWDRLRSGQNPFSKRPRYGLGPGVCYSEEIIKYLLALLDPVKDSKEIGQLKSDQAKLQAMGRAVTPIIVSLEEGIALKELINPAANIQFDLDGSALDRRWTWITPRAAWLVYDHDGSGRITSGLQMFGSVTFWIFWRDGYDALSSLDDNADARLTGSELTGLALWHDRNSNGVSDSGEVRSVTDHGIIAIECRKVAHESGIVFNPQGVLLKDHATRATYDWVADMK